MDKIDNTPKMKHRRSTSPHHSPSTSNDPLDIADTPFGLFRRYDSPNHEKFIRESKSGYLFDKSTGFYHDEKTKYYYNPKSKEWMFWTKTYSTYIPCQGGDVQAKKKLQEKELVEELARKKAVEDDKSARGDKANATTSLRDHVSKKATSKQVPIKSAKQSRVFILDLLPNITKTKLLKLIQEQDFEPVDVKIDRIVLGDFSVKTQGIVTFSSLSEAAMWGVLKWPDGKTSELSFTEPKNKEVKNKLPEGDAKDQSQEISSTSSDDRREADAVMEQNDMPSSTTDPMEDRKDEDTEIVNLQPASIFNVRLNSQSIPLTKPNIVKPSNEPETLTSSSQVAEQPLSVTMPKVTTPPTTTKDAFPLAPVKTILEVLEIAQEQNRYLTNTFKRSGRLSQEDSFTLETNRLKIKNLMTQIGEDKGKIVEKLKTLTPNILLLFKAQNDYFNDTLVGKIVSEEAIPLVEMENKFNGLCKNLPKECMDLFESRPSQAQISVRRKTNSNDEPHVNPMSNVRESNKKEIEREERSSSKKSHRKESKRSKSPKKGSKSPKKAPKSSKKRSRSRSPKVVVKKRRERSSSIEETPKKKKNRKEKDRPRSSSSDRTYGSRSRSPSRSRSRSRSKSQPRSRTKTRRHSNRKSRSRSRSRTLSTLRSRSRRRSMSSRKSRSRSRSSARVTRRRESSEVSSRNSVQSKDKHPIYNISEHLFEFKRFLERINKKITGTRQFTWNLRSTYQRKQQITPYELRVCNHCANLGHLEKFCRSDKSASTKARATKKLVNLYLKFRGFDYDSYSDHSSDESDSSEAPLKPPKEGGPNDLCPKVLSCSTYLTRQNLKEAIQQMVKHGHVTIKDLKFCTNCGYLGHLPYICDSSTKIGQNPKTTQRFNYFFKLLDEYRRFNNISKDFPYSREDIPSNPELTGDDPLSNQITRLKWIHGDMLVQIWRQSAMDAYEDETRKDIRKVLKELSQNNSSMKQANFVKSITQLYHVQQSLAEEIYDRIHEKFQKKLDCEEVSIEFEALDMMKKLCFNCAEIGHDDKKCKANIYSQAGDGDIKYMERLIEIYKKMGPAKVRNQENPMAKQLAESKDPLTLQLLLVKQKHQADLNQLWKNTVIEAAKTEQNEEVKQILVDLTKKPSITNKHKNFIKSLTTTYALQPYTAEQIWGSLQAEYGKALAEKGIGFDFNEDDYLDKFCTNCAQIGHVFDDCVYMRADLALVERMQNAIKLYKSMHGYKINEAVVKLQEKMSEKVVDEKASEIAEAINRAKDILSGKKKHAPEKRSEKVEKAGNAELIQETSTAPIATTEKVSHMSDAMPSNEASEVTMASEIDDDAVYASDEEQEVNMAAEAEDESGETPSEHPTTTMKTATTAIPASKPVTKLPPSTYYAHILTRPQLLEAIRYLVPQGSVDIKDFKLCTNCGYLGHLPYVCTNAVKLSSEKAPQKLFQLIQLLDEYCLKNYLVKTIPDCREEKVAKNPNPRLTGNDPLNMQIRRLKQKHGVELQKKWLDSITSCITPDLEDDDKATLTELVKKPVSLKPDQFINALMSQFHVDSATALKLWNRLQEKFQKDLAEQGESSNFMSREVIKKLCIKCAQIGHEPELCTESLYSCAGKDDVEYMRKLIELYQNRGRPTNFVPYQNQAPYRQSFHRPPQNFIRHQQRPNFRMRQHGNFRPRMHQPNLRHTRPYNPRHFTHRTHDPILRTPGMPFPPPANMMFQGIDFSKDYTGKQ